MTPITYLCTPRALMPVPRFAERFDREFEAGKYYAMEVVTERSREQHNLYFKAMDVAFNNLPDDIGKHFPASALGASHYRKHCLIDAGFCHQRAEPYGSEEEAKRAQALARWQSAMSNDYSESVVEGRVLVVRIARTQAYKKNDPDGMDKKDFKASMDACLLIAATHIGVSVDQLLAEAKQRMVRRRRL